MATFNKVLVAVILQEYARAAKNIKKRGISSSLLGIRELVIISGYCYRSQEGSR